MKSTARAGVGLVIAIAFLAIAQPGNAESGYAPNAATPEPEHQSKRRLVINVRAQTLELFENNEWVKSYQIAVGKPSTPLSEAALTRLPASSPRTNRPLPGPGAQPFLQEMPAARH